MCDTEVVETGNKGALNMGLLICGTFLERVHYTFQHINTHRRRHGSVIDRGSRESNRASVDGGLVSRGMSLVAQKK